MARIIEFQGRRISVPDNATDEQIRQILAQEASGSSAFEESLANASRMSQFGSTGVGDLPPPAEPSLVDQIMGALNYADDTGAIVVDRIGEGAANVAGLPVDLINAAPMLANIVPGVDGVGPISPNPVGGSDWLNSARKGFGVVPDAPVPQDAFQTVVGRVGEEIGAAALPVGGVLAAAARKGLPAIRSSGSALARMFLEPAAVNPARFVGHEAGAATAAGLGAGLANLVVDPNTTQGQVADMAGAIGGTGLYGLAAIVGRGLNQVFNAARQNPNYLDQVVKDVVVDRVGKAAGLDGSEMRNGVYDTDPLIAQIMEGATARPSEVIPGFQESLADRTAIPGIAALEYSRQSGPNSGLFTRQRSANNEAVDAAMRGVEPVETPGAFRSELETQRDLRLAAAAEGTQEAQSEFDRYIQSLSPSMLAEERGATIREGLTNAERAAREVESAAWTGINGEVDPAPLADTIDDTIDNLSVARHQRIADLGETVDIPRQLSGTPEEPGGPVSIQELNDMRSVLLQEQRNALSGPQPDRNRAEAIGRLIDDVNTYLDSDAVPENVREQTAEARAVSLDVNERFNRPNDPIASVLATSQGRPDVPDSAVGPRFVQPDTRQASNIDRLLAETDLSSHGGSVRAAVKDEILGGIERQGALTDPDRLERYLGQFTRVFDRFPDLREEIVEAIGAGRQLNEAGAAEGTLRADVGAPDGTVRGKGPVGKYLQYSDAQAERAISEVLASKDPGRAADELLSFVDGNPKALEGARAAFWQKLKRESQSVDNSQRSMSGGRAWRGDWLKSFLDNPATAAVAERLYRDTPEQLETIRKFAEVLDNVDLRQRGKAVGTSGTGQSINPVLTPETLQSRFYAYMRGAVGGTYLATSIAAVMARRAIRNAQTDAIERLTDQVLLNPELAAQLLKENNPANRAALARKAKLWFGNEASTFLNLMDEEGDEGSENEPLRIVVEGANPISEDDDTVSAVMR